MQGSCQLEKIERKDRPKWIESDAANALAENKKHKIKRVKKARAIKRRKEQGEKITAIRGGNKL